MGFSLRRAFKKLGRGIRKTVKSIGEIAPGVVSGFVMGGPFGAVAGAVSGLSGADPMQQALAGAGAGVLSGTGFVGETGLPWLQQTIQKGVSWAGNLLGGPFATADTGLLEGQVDSYDDYLGDVYGRTTQAVAAGPGAPLAGMAPGGGILDQKNLPLLLIAGVGLFLLMKK